MREEVLKVKKEMEMRNTYFSECRNKHYFRMKGILYRRDRQRSGNWGEWKIISGKGGI